MTSSRPAERSNFDALAGPDGTADPVMPTRPDLIYPDPTADDISGRRSGGAHLPAPILTLPPPSPADLVPDPAALREAERQLAAQRAAAERTATQAAPASRAARQSPRPQSGTTRAGRSTPTAGSGGYGYVSPPSSAPPATAPAPSLPGTLSGLPTSARRAIEAFQRAAANAGTASGTRVGQFGGTGTSTRTRTRAKSRSGSSAVGCLVFLVFVIIAMVNAGSGLFHALGELFQDIFGGR